jgi:3-hydroxyisobutyrate dehydrogenase
LSGERVGFVGLGRMGWPMARNLAGAGDALVVRDLDDGVQERFAAEYGATAAGNPADFAGCDVVVTMLPDDRSVREALLEWEGGIASALAPPAVVVDMSSSNPRGTRATGAELAAHGLALVDAPVSGGVPRAEAGTLSIMAGADDGAALERALPVLEVLGGRVFRTGPLGSGHAMKALNNYTGAAAYAAAAEALEIGRRYGLEPETMIEVINASTGRSFNSEHVFGEHVLPGTYATGFALGLMAKDVAIAADLADASGVDTPVCRLVSERWAAALDGLGFTADHSEAHKTWWPDGTSATADTMEPNDT